MHTNAYEPTVYQADGAIRRMTVSQLCYDSLRKHLEYSLV